MDLEDKDIIEYHEKIGKKFYKYFEDDFFKVKFYKVGLLESRYNYLIQLFEHNKLNLKFGQSIEVKRLVEGYYIIYFKYDFRRPCTTYKYDEI